MSFAPTATESRFSDICDVLKARHPESADLLQELSNLSTDLVVEGEDRAVRRQTEAIMDSIGGDLTEWDGCEPQWSSKRPSRLVVVA